MGLAASQARLLAITARKMNCEFQSMQIAQQRLSVTRDLQKASQDYQNSLDVTKLVWDPDGEYDGDVYELSYDIMMSPSEMNEYNPYFVTNKSGRILLSNEMYQAAVKAGLIDAATGDPITGRTNVSGRDNFLNALTDYNLIDGVLAQTIKNLPNSYKKSGLGGEVYSTSDACELRTNEFINYMKTITYQGAADKYGSAIPTAVNPNDKIYGLQGVPWGSSNKIWKNGSEISNITDLTIGDLLSGEYVTDGDDSTYKSMLNDITDILSRGLYVDEESKEALRLAKQFTETLCLYGTVCADSVADLLKQKSDDSLSYYMTAMASYYNQLVEDKNGTKYFSITNMVKSFLTNFAIMLEGFDCGFDVNPGELSNSRLVTDDAEYYFVLNKGSVMTETNMLNANFYNMLYNQIATNGAISDQTMRDLYLEDNRNLQQALKNGSLFISSLHNDGYYYQGAYTLSGHIAEVTDEDAIARAEIEYNVQKSKLNHKEETLELQMKNLDMEISSLTTEMDSVKNLISKGVEKVFTMFST